MTLDYQCVTEEAVASSRPMKARQYVTPETLTDESTSTRNCRDAIFYYMSPLQALAAYELTHDGCRRDCGDFFRRQGHYVIQELEQADGLGICRR